MNFPTPGSGTDGAVARSTRFVKIAACAMFAGLAATSSVNATTVNISFTNTGTVVAGSTIFSADIASSGLSSLASVTITDSNSGVGGASGIFSGFDLDALVIDIDGNIATVGDQVFASSYSFSAGTTRATASAAEMPNAAHPGPTFGSLDASTIDLATATLETFDGISIADVSSANGFLTLGDGGSLTAFFVPDIPVGATLFLLAGEVGGNGEDLAAAVTVSDVINTPAPATLFLLLGGVGALSAFARRKRSGK